MKHLKHLFTAIMLFCSLSANAYDFTANGIYYKFIQGTSNAVEVTYTGTLPYAQSSYSGSITIPENVTYGNNTYEVTRIGDNAFYKSSITSVTIPCSVTSIGNSAFDNSSITRVTIPSSVTSIGSSAFYNCSSLNSVHITDLSAWCKIDIDGWSSNPLYYADYLYLNGNLIENLVIPDDITEIKTYAFYRYSRLASVEFHNGVTSIGSYAFGGCTELADIVFPSNITNIGDYAFGDTQWYYNQPDGEIYIGDLLFRYKGSMPANTAYTIKEGTKYIADSAFADCENLTRVTIPSSVTKIGGGIFAWCFKLKDIFCYATTVPKAENLFVEINLHSIALHVPVESLEMYKASDDWNIFGSLTYIGEEIYVDGIKYSISPTTKEAAVIAHDNQYSGDIEIPERITYNNTTYNVTDIICNAFRECSLLTSVVIPNSVTNIGGAAFIGCTGLTSIEIPNSVTSIGYGAFANCSGLTKAVIGNGVTDIGERAFSNCNKLASIIVGANVTTIGEYAFSGCTELKKIYNFSMLDIKKSSNEHGDIAYYAEKVTAVPRGIIVGDFIFDTTCYPNALTTYIGNDNNIVLPENYIYGNYTIGEYAFSYNGPIRSVTIPDCVTSIGDHAFEDCWELENITIGNSVKRIGEYAFEECTGLTSITIPNSVTYIGSSAFCACTGLTSITIPDNVTYIGSYAFANCPVLTHVTIPDNVTYIGEKAFAYTAWYDNQSESVVYIGKILYKYNGDMPENTSIIIKDGTTSIAGNAFSGCTGLTSIEIPNSVTSIGESAFNGCSGITSVEIPNSVTSIGGSAFRGCSGLTSVEIPNSVTSIGESAFSGCSGLTSVEIPNSVTSIGSYAFYGCSGLKSVHISDISAWCNIGFGDASANPLLYAKNLYLNGELVTELVIPDGVAKIKDYAFYGCSGLTSVEIPNSVTSIGGSAFRGCSGLTSVEIPNSVTSIGYYAFYGCSGLTSIEIPNSVTNIGSYAFYGCSGLTSIEIPNSVTSIESSAFYGCSGLTSIEIPNSVTSIGSSAFSDCSGLTSITIPNSVTSIEYGAFNGCSGLTSIEIPNSVTSIGWSAFDGCSGLTSVEIPNNVTSIENYAFSGCSGLTSITIPNSVTSIGNSTFNGCSGLTSVEIPTSVTSIGGYAFNGCSGLTSITIPNSVTSIGNSTFNGCSGLTSVEIPNSVTSIGGYAFCNCSGLTSIEIPNSVTSIGSYAFSGCTGLTNVTIPNSVTSIGSYTFNGCTGLTNITIPNSVTSIATSAFGGCTSLKNLHIEDSEKTLSFGYDGRNLFNDCPLENLYLGCNIQHATSKYDYYSPFYNKSTLTRVIIGNKVSAIYESGFQGCTNLKTVINFSNINLTKGSTGNGKVAYYAERLTNVPDGKIEGNFIFGTIDDENKLIAYLGRNEKIDLPEHYNNECYAIGDYAFENMDFITEIAIPQNVTGIGNRSFYGCTALKSLTIPNKVTSIGSYAFNGCTGLTEVSIGNGVTSVGASAFSGCTILDKLYIGNSIESIGNYAFGGCNNIMEIIASSQKAITANENVFSTDTYNNARLYVPTGRKFAYEKTVPWKNFYIEEMDLDVSHTVTFMVGGNVYETAQVKFSETIPLPVEPVKEHYTFDGWENLPATMPAKDVTVNALFTAKSYTVTFMIDGTAYRTISVKYGETIPLPAGPSREGYIFSWNDVPVTMPGEDITIMGTFTLKSYNAIFVVDGKRYHSVALKEGETIPLPEEPAIEGYTFDGWDFIPDVMPGKDVTITALLTAKSYTVTFMDGEEVHETRTVKYGENITVPEMPEKENYTFVWNDVPSKMPAYNIVIYGSYTVNSYTVTFTVDGKAYATVEVKYGEAITLPQEPVKAGYTFNGWNNLPATMPAEDITVTASFTAAGYTVTFVIDGEVYATVPVKYGEEIPLPQEPVKVGHTFKGWSRTPDTMPANDVTVTGSFTVNSYTVTFLVDGKVHKSVAVKYGEEIPLPKEPKKDGYTFSGWENLPATMPAEEITVTALFTANSYTVTFVIDGEVYATAQVNYGDAITLPQEPVKEGHTFNGWNNLPATMPKKDITATGSFTVNSYTVTFTIDGEVYATVQVNYGEEIALPQEPVKDGYTFNGWNDIPETMPAEDITVNGTFTEHTGIDAAAEEVEVIVYNLKGERITDTGNLAKGVYIINGKKTVVR